jgi:hypothetical protein
MKKSPFHVLRLAREAREEATKALDHAWTVYASAADDAITDACFEAFPKGCKGGPAGRSALKGAMKDRWYACKRRGTAFPGCEAEHAAHAKAKRAAKRAETKWIDALQAAEGALDTLRAAYGQAAPKYAPSPGVVIVDSTGPSKLVVTAATSTYKNGKGWRQDEPASATITVRDDWDRMVGDVPGLALAAGLLTLSAGKARKIKGVPVRPAKWITWGRGYDLSHVTGFIAGDAATGWSHTYSEREAVALHQKRNAKLTPTKPIRKITWATGRRFGLCAVGMRAWAQTYLPAEHVARGWTDPATFRTACAKAGTDRADYSGKILHALPTTT